MDELSIVKLITERIDRTLGKATPLIDLIEQRLALGHAQYGAWDLSADDRDLVREALDEALDLAIYLAATLIQLDRGDR
jgi:hypothetical protein